MVHGSAGALVGHGFESNGISSIGTGVDLSTFSSSDSGKLVHNAFECGRDSAHPDASTGVDVGPLLKSGLACVWLT